MPLEGRNAAIYGAGGVIGAAVARSLARDGATVHLAGRTADPLERVAGAIDADGGRASTAVVDATDEDAVAAHVRDLVERVGGLDVVVNVVTFDDVQGGSLLDLPTAAVTGSLLTAVRAHSATTRAGARHMIDRGRGGVVLTVVGHGPPHPGMGTTALTWQSIEALYRQWAADLGPHGVRVAWVRIGGTVEAFDVDRETSFGGATPNDDLLAEVAAGTMLGRLPRAAEVGDAVAFLAGERGRSITAGALNLTAGATAD